MAKSTMINQRAGTTAVDMSKSMHNPFAAPDERGVSQAEKLVEYRERKERLAKYKEEQKVSSNEQGESKSP